MLNTILTTKSGKYFSVVSEVGPTLCRVAALLNADSFTYHFNIRGVEHSCTLYPGQQKYGDLKLSAAEEAWLTSEAETIDGSVDFVTGSGIKTYKLVLRCIAATTEDFCLEDEKAMPDFNGFIADSDTQRKVCYLDAYYGAGAFAKARITVCDKYTAASPLDLKQLNTVFLAGMTDSLITLLARASDKLFAKNIMDALNKNMQFKSAFIVSGLNLGTPVPDFPVFCINNAEAASTFDDEEVQLVNSDPDLYSPRYYVRNDSGAKIPFEFTQTGIFIDGKPFDARSYMELLQVIGFFELGARTQYGSLSTSLVNLADDEDNGSLIFDVSLDATQHWTCKDKVSDFWKKYCYNNTYLNPWFSRFQSTRTGILLTNDKGQYASLTNEDDSISCCALSLSYILGSTSGKTSIGEMLQIMPQLLDNGIITIDKTGINSKQLIGGGVFTKMSVIVGNEAVNNVDRVSIPFNQLQEGEMYLMKLRKPNRKQNHYIVIHKQGDSIIALYDPWRKSDYFAAGANVTTFVNADAEFWQFTREA